MLTSTAPARAQPADAPTPQALQEAASAFAEGQRAQLRGDHARAAELFEIANFAAPSAAALRSAVRNHRAAGHTAQAATGALEALARYSSDGPTARLSNEVLVELGPRLARVLIECLPECTASLDARTVGRGTFARIEVFVEPGSHTVRAGWPDYRPVEQTFTGVAGQPQAIRLERPAAPIETPPPPPRLEVSSEPQNEEADSSTPPPFVPPPPRRSGMSPAVFWVGTGLTLVATGITIWSGMDTLSARDDYENDPTEGGYDDGVNLELRTNALIATSSVLGVATIAIGLFLTDWGPSEVHPMVALGPDGALVGMQGEL